MKSCKRICAQIDLDAIAYNMKQMKENIPANTSMIAVIKMDGYGHGSVPIAKMLESKEYVWGFATAILEEAVVLRKAGIQKPILVLGCIYEDQYEEMLQYEIRPTVYMEELAKQISEAAQRAGRLVHCHVKIDTGMGRIGFPADQEGVEAIQRIAQMPNLKVEGVFTHFAKADEYDKSYTIKQHEKFSELKNALESLEISVPYYHCDNSAGIIEFPDYGHDLVRAGISLYGMYPSAEVDAKKVSLKPSLRLVSHVTFVKTVAPGTAISYGGTFVAEREMRVATIPVGYGDGYPRALSNKAEVLIQGKRASILGRVCMDQFMVDVTEIPDVKYGTEVVLIGEDGEDAIRVEELSQISGKFNYEFVCGLDKRVPRVYFQNGEMTEMIDYLA